MLTVSDIMTSRPLCITPKTTLAEAMRLMRQNDYQHLPVAEKGRLLGMLTERDVRAALNASQILYEGLSNHTLLVNILVENCMTTDPIAIQASAPAYEAAIILETHKFSSLPVVADGMLVGIVTVGDILRSYAHLLSGQEAVV